MDRDSVDLIEACRRTIDRPVSVEVRAARGQNPRIDTPVAQLERQQPDSSFGATRKDAEPGAHKVDPAHRKPLGLPSDDCKVRRGSKPGVQNRQNRVQAIRKGFVFRERHE